MGITRAFVIKLFKKAGLVVEEKEIKLKELLSADKIFITGTFKGILSIVEVDDEIIGGGNVGEKTKQGMELLKVIMESEY
jgi:branched-subunit amino acid aminotransferase/4-amino-4-deoxychorismate lyase